MNRAVVIVLLCGASAIAQPKFSAPVVGIARDSRQQIRIVHGLPGTFVLHDAIGGKVVDWAFDSKGGMVKTDAELLTLGANGAVVRRQPAPRGGAVLGPQSAFFPQASELWLQDRKITLDSGIIAGRVMALGTLQGRGIQVAVCRANDLWLLSVDTRSGSVTQELAPGGVIGKGACISPGGGSLVLLRDRVLLATAHGIVIQTAAGIERNIPIRASQAARAGEQWVEIEDAGGPARMIRIANGGEQVYQLPAAKERP